MISLKNEVKSITVIEKNPGIVNLFKKYILSQFKYKNKIRIIESNVFVDIYHDVGDGLDDYIYFKLLERNDTVYDYWIEKTIKCYL